MALIMCHCVYDPLGGAIFTGMLKRKALHPFYDAKTRHHVLQAAGENKHSMAALHGVQFPSDMIDFQWLHDIITLSAFF